MNGNGNGNGDQGDNGNGYGGNGNNSTYDIAPKIEAIGPSLKDKYDLDLAKTENEKILAEAELEKSKTEFLEAQIGKVDPAKVPLASFMPEAKEPPSIFPLLIVAGIWFSMKFFK